MAKIKSAYVCTDCGADHSRWQGQCMACSAWNTLQEIKLSSGKKSTTPVVPTSSSKGYSGAVEAQVKNISDVNLAEVPRISSSMKELDRVLGGALSRVGRVDWRRPWCRKIVHLIAGDVSAKHRIQCAVCNGGGIFTASGIASQANAVTR